MFAIVAQFYIAVVPINRNPNVYNFFMYMWGLPIILFLYIGWKIWKKPCFVRASDADLVNGRRDLDPTELDNQRAERVEWGRARRYLCIIITLMSQDLSFALLNAFQRTMGSEFRL